MITAELKRNWVKALKSGKYEQAQGVLREKNLNSQAFCCLGVLCDISGNGMWIEEQTDYSDSYFKLKNSRKLDTKTPNSWLGRETTKKLIDLNDEQGYSFKQIAKWVENNIKVKA